MRPLSEKQGHLYLGSKQRRDALNGTALRLLGYGSWSFQCQLYLLFFFYSSFSDFSLLREDVNMLYQEMKEHWESYQAFQAMANQEAARTDTHTMSDGQASQAFGSLVFGL